MSKCCSACRSIFNRIDRWFKKAGCCCIHDSEKKIKLKPYPSVVCYNCGINASKGKVFETSCYHKAKCDVCGKIKSVTEPRDYYYPKFKGHKY